MRDCLANTGKDIVYSVCCWHYPGDWVVEAGNYWRTTSDIVDSWAKIQEIYKINQQHWQSAKPGAFNDADMLEVGNGAMSITEWQSHFNLWCIMASPLLCGNDMTKLNQAIKDILLNPETIAIDQDSLGLQGHIIAEPSSGTEVWCKPLQVDSAKGELCKVAVLLLNNTSSSKTISINFNAEYIRYYLMEDYKTHVRDLVKCEDKDSVENSISASVESHGSLFATLTQVDPTVITGYYVNNVTKDCFDLHADDSKIHFTLNGHSGLKKSFVSMKLYDVKGTLIKTFVNDYRAPGRYSVDFCKSDLASGAYVCNLRLNGFSETIKIIKK